MAVNWNLQAVEILETLGCTGTGGRKVLDSFEKESGVKLPKKLYEFLCVAYNSPLFSTADIWTGKSPALCFLYEEIDEMIESDHEYWEKNPADYVDNDYYQISQIPREDWGQKVSNYLLIGSDYGAGVVEFGIRTEDLDQDDPPVYMQHECDPITVWSLHNKTVSDYIMQVLCDVLSCCEYSTAQHVLEKAGWRFQEYKPANQRQRKPAAGTLAEGQALLKERGVDLSQAVYCHSDYGSDAYCACGWDADTQTFYISREDREAPCWGNLLIFSKS